LIPNILKHKTVKKKTREKLFASLQDVNKNVWKLPAFFFYKVKTTLYAVIRAQWVLKGIAVPMLILRVSLGCLVESTTLPLYPRERDAFPIEYAAMWTPWQVRTGAGNSTPPAFETRTFQSVAISYTDYPLPSYL
jgi:hypothetical protein